MNKKNKPTSLPQFYISIIKDTKEYKEILGRVDKLSKLITDISRATLTDEQLEFIRDFSGFTQPLDNVFVSPVATVDVPKNLDTYIRLDLPSDRLVFQPISRSRPSIIHSKPTILCIDELFLDGDIYRKFVQLIRLGKSNPLGRILRRIFEEDRQMMRVLWPFPDFKLGCSVFPGIGIGSTDGYKFFKDVEDLKSGYPDLYTEIVNTYKANIPQIVTLMNKLSAVSDIIENSNNKQKLFTKYHNVK